MRCIFLNDRQTALQKVYMPQTVKELMEYGFENKTYTKNELIENKSTFSDVECIFSTWGMPQLSKEEIAEILPNLKCVFYAAGSVQKFARPFLESGVRVFSAFAANAVPVAQFVLAQTVLANKGFFTLSDKDYTKNRPLARSLMEQYPGNYAVKVGIIGAGMIGSMVCEGLVQMGIEVLVFDPFLSDERAAELGVTKCSLAQLFADCFVISNHLANNEKTKGMLGKELFCSMQKNAVFINTGRGAQVKEDELIRVLKQRPDITALLDVTEPEPPLEDSELYTLPNCILTPHIAGSSGREVYRMAEYMKTEFLNWQSGKDTKYEITLRMLETMA